jgi:enolase
MSYTIKTVDAFEILDSRGNPALRVRVELDSGHIGTASVPSGASTGRREAVEIRDDDPARYNGKGLLKAISIVRTFVQERLKGLDAAEQAAIDKALIELDGTEDKSWLGGNVTVGVSMAVARVSAVALNQPLYEYLNRTSALRLPVPLINVINGGRHAENSLDFQEFMIVPHQAPSFAEAIRMAAETFHALKAILRKYGHSTAVGDEGGFAPNLKSHKEACELIVEAIQHAGFRPGIEIAMALDPAATSFWKDGQYVLERSGASVRSSSELLDDYANLVKDYPIVSIEDGLAEDDWDGFRAQTAALGDEIQIVGDDMYATNPTLIRRGIEARVTNAALIKLNQVGTISETVDAIALCRDAGWPYIISHRSGETEDSFISDFAVAMGASQIKAGSLSRSERLAKYNRLLEIERELGSSATYESPFHAHGMAPPPSGKGNSITTHESPLLGSALVRERARLRREPY